MRNGMRNADVEDVELHEAKMRIRLLEPENEIVRRPAAYQPLSNLPSEPHTCS